MFAGATDVVPQMRAGRSAPDVLVDLKKIEELLKCNHHCFGENRLEELESKWIGLNKKNLRIHFIGALQSKKVNDATKEHDKV